MRIDWNNFLLSLAAQMAADCELTLGETLTVHQADEKFASVATAYSTLRMYAGGTASRMIQSPEAAIQIDTRGKIQASVLEQANTLYDWLLDDNFVPRGQFALAGKKVVAGEVADDTISYEIHLFRPGPRPGVVGLDENKRSIAPFNFDVRVHAVEA